MMLLLLSPILPSHRTCLSNLQRSTYRISLPRLINMEYHKWLSLFRFLCTLFHILLHWYSVTMIYCNLWVEWKHQSNIYIFLPCPHCAHSLIVLVNVNSDINVIIWGFCVSISQKCNTDKIFQWWHKFSRQPEVLLNVAWVSRTYNSPLQYSKWKERLLH